MNTLIVNKDTQHAVDGCAGFLNIAYKIAKRVIMLYLSIGLLLYIGGTLNAYLNLGLNAMPLLQWLRIPWQYRMPLWGAQKLD